MARKKSKQVEVASWVYILLLTSVTILGYVLSKFDFTLFKVTLAGGIFVYPFRYFVANIITKKYGYKETMNGISYSALMLLLFITVSSLLSSYDINYIPVTGEIFAYIISQMINLTIYKRLMDNKDNNKLSILATYIFAMLVDNLVSMLFASRMMVRAFFGSYLLTIIVEAIVAFILIWFCEKEVKKR